MTLMFCECVVLYRNINKKGCHFVMLVHLFCEVYFFFYTMYRNLLRENKIKEHVSSYITCKFKASGAKDSQLSVKRSVKLFDGYFQLTGLYNIFKNSSLSNFVTNLTLLGLFNILPQSTTIIP